MHATLESTEAEIEALDRLCERLAGFDPGVSVEWLDGAFAALLCGPRTVPPAEWLPLLFGDTWERAVADPDDLAASMHTLLRRWNVLADQLHPQRLFGEPDRLHILPLIDEFDPAQRDALVAEGKLTPEEAADWPATGELWASGFLDVVEHLAQDWQLADETGDAARERDACLRCIEALGERDAASLQADLAIRSPGKGLDRDALVDEACFAVQDLRCFWLEHATRPAPRRVDKTPGRNEPCPCGSGKKYKKCHGAGPALH
ncbi:MAG TPA: UPF0149 family protein [Rubrivivax sp.]|nr:UPF0149 family protein [Rubrivivax sp.]